jgi:hypothetical protein
MKGHLLSLLIVSPFVCCDMFFLAFLRHLFLRLQASFATTFAPAHDHPHLAGEVTIYIGDKANPMVPSA